MARFAVILPAAGRSTRFGGPRQSKIHADLDGRAVWLHALDPFVDRDDVAEIVVAISPDDRERFEFRYRPSLAFHNIRAIDGGAERHDSIARALAALGPTADHVAIHDAARPCLGAELVDAVFAAAVAHGAAILAVPVADTLKRVGPDRTIAATVPRAGLFAAQTPQAFRRDLLVAAYAGRKAGDSPTDDASLVEALGHPVAVVEGSPMNLKITTAADLRLAAAILRSLAAPKPDPRKSPDDLFD